MKLAGFLAQPRPAWDWVQHDCCRWVDRWVQMRGHGSPIAALGLVYDSERSALRRIAEGGGLAALWQDGMARLGIMPTDVLTVGAVGVIQRATLCGQDEAAAIWTGERWITLGLRGLDYAPAGRLKAWSV